MIPPLPAAFLQAPIAHRALHDISNNRPENSRAAIRAAIDAGYGIEIDLQLTADDRAVVFHDYDMGRLTGQPGPIRQVSAAAASELTLLYGDDGIPTLDEVLDMVAGGAAADRAEGSGRRYGYEYRRPRARHRARIAGL